MRSLWLLCRVLQKKNHDAGNAQSISHKEEMLLGISHKGEMKEKGFAGQQTLFSQKKKPAGLAKKRMTATAAVSYREERAGT